MKIFKLLSMATGAAALGTAGVSVYFFNTIMKRVTKDRERTMEMSGTDWYSYSDIFDAGREVLSKNKMEQISIRSRDGLRLNGYFYPKSDSKKLVIMCHGYTGDAKTNFLGQAMYFEKNGFNMLMPDARTHGESEGKYVGFGCLDRHDLYRWIKWSLDTLGSDIEIVLYGVSMGGATVLMASGLELPDQVKGIVADCPFTSAKEVFSHVLSTMYHLPPAPILAFSDQMCKKLAGYGLDECNSKREVEYAQVPFLLIHGSNDTFVPATMTPEIARHCATEVTQLIIEGAAHAESYYKDTTKYEAALDTFFNKVLGKY